MSISPHESHARKIELLSPARDCATGIAAIDHGADAVYIGAPKFGAREDASNSVADIARLVAYAHQFGAKVYATLNTIIYDNELEEARRLALSLCDAGVDALLIQDAAYLTMGLPAVAFHASTQCDNRTPEKIERLYSEGFTTAVLARELGIEEIKAIHARCPQMRLECFVHGALCVSYSGRCYASQHCFGRSANRGACAQFCRMPFNLEDEQGHVIMRQKHLLSLRDLNRTASLEQLLDAGVSSLKIEGRLKSIDYVKNITAWYRARLDEIMAKRLEYVRASAGESVITFTPDPEKSFNRGFTEYFLHGRTSSLACIDTPKSIGEHVGEVSFAGDRCIVINGSKKLSNGDGLAFFTHDGRMKGFRVNRVEGNKLYPAEMPAQLRPHTQLFRTHDEAFIQMLSKPTATRTLKLYLSLSESPDGYVLSARDELGRSAEAHIQFAHEDARSEQTPNIVKQLSKLGGTAYRLEHADISCGGRFIPSSLLATARREVVNALKDAKPAEQPRQASAGSSYTPALPRRIDYSYNVANSKSREFYERLGAIVDQPAWEVNEPDGMPIMTCRYCIRHEIGECLKNKNSRQGKLFLRLANGKRFRLEFCCKDCCMKVYAD